MSEGQKDEFEDESKDQFKWELIDRKNRENPFSITSRNSIESVGDEQEKAGPYALRLR